MRLHLRTQPLHKQHTPTLCSQWFTHYCFTHTQLDIPPKLTTSVTVPWEQGGGIKQDCSRNNTWACLIQATHLRPAKASLWARLTTRPTPSSAGKQAYKSIPHADLCRKKQTTKLCNCERKADLHSRATSKANNIPKPPTRTRKRERIGHGVNAGSSVSSEPHCFCTWNKMRRRASARHACLTAAGYAAECCGIHTNITRGNCTKPPHSQQQEKHAVSTPSTHTDCSAGHCKGSMNCNGATNMSAQTRLTPTRMCDRTRLMVPVPGHTTKKEFATTPHRTADTTHACVCQRLPTLALCTNTGPTDFRPTVRTPVPLDPPPAFITRSSSTECFATWTRNLDTEQCPHQCKHQGTRQRSHYRAHSSATTSFGAGGRDRQAGAKATAAHNDSAAKLQTGKQPCLTATVAKRG